MVVRDLDKINKYTCIRGRHPECDAVLCHARISIHDSRDLAVRTFNRIISDQDRGQDISLIRFACDSYIRPFRCGYRVNCNSTFPGLIDRNAVYRILRHRKSYCKTGLFSIIAVSNMCPCIVAAGPANVFGISDQNGIVILDGRILSIVPYSAGRHVFRKAALGITLAFCGLFQLPPGIFDRIQHCLRLGI